MKTGIYFILTAFLFSCKPSIKENLVQVSTMGTTGSIKYLTQKSANYQKEIDSLLLEVNKSLSTWMDSSTISKFNRKEIDFKTAMSDLHLNPNEKVSYRINKETNGAFNPAIMSLVQYWKVQSKNIATYELEVDSFKIDSLAQFINEGQLKNKQLDFSAIAKGYGVDVIADFLENKGVENYMVEIGGEVHCKGVNINEKSWKIGIEEPNEDARNIFEVVHLKDKSMATSGNYRNFKILDSGQKIVHIINPKTGYPEISNLLSASIITDDCMEADAYATACMVMGLDECFKFIKSKEKIEGYLIYSNEKGTLETKVSDGFKEYLK